MKENVIVNTDTIVIKVNYYGQKHEDYSTVESREKTVTVNDKVVYREWQTCPEFQSRGNTGVALQNLEERL